MAAPAEQWEVGSGPEEAAPWDRDARAAALRTLVISRGLLLAVSLAVALKSVMSPVAVWNQWDTTWYLGIAAHGYHWVLPGHHASAFVYATLAFFPLMPLLLHLALGIGVDGTLAGLVIANCAFAGAALYAYALLREEWGAVLARKGLLLLALLPTAFFLAAPYTEPLFLLAASGTLWHARKGQVAQAGLWFGVAVVTRSTALILIVPAVMLVRPRNAWHWLALFLPAAAAWCVYLLYLVHEHVPLSYLLDAQRAWHRGLTFPWMGFVSSVTWLLHNTFLQPQLAVENVGEMIATLLFLAITIKAWSDLPPYLRAYCVGFWLLVLCTPEWRDGYAAPFSSMDRFILALFPLAGWAAERIPARWWGRMLVASGLMMGVAAGVHLSGGWIG